MELALFQEVMKISFSSIEEDCHKFRYTSFSAQQFRMKIFIPSFGKYPFKKKRLGLPSDIKIDISQEYVFGGR